MLALSDSVSCTFTSWQHYLRNMIKVATCCKGWEILISKGAYDEDNVINVFF